MIGFDMRAILLVDDDEGLTEILSENFAEIGVGIQRASSGKEALERLQQEPFDAILLDVKMPDMDGLELLCEINKHGILTPVVMFTGYPQPSIILRALRLGALDFIEKPCPMAELREVMQRAIEIGIRIRAFEHEMDAIVHEMPKELAERLQRLRSQHRATLLWKLANYHHSKADARTSE